MYFFTSIEIGIEIEFCLKNYLFINESFNSHTGPTRSSKGQVEFQVTASAMHREVLMDYRSRSLKIPHILTGTKTNNAVN